MVFSNLKNILKCNKYTNKVVFMKKDLVLLMMLALVVSVVSAGSVYLDTGVSFSNGSRRYVTNKDLEYDLSVTSLPVEVGYRHVLDNNILISGSIS